MSASLSDEPVPWALLACVPADTRLMVPLLELTSLLASLLGAAPKIKTPTAPLMPAKPPPPAVAVTMSMSASRNAATDTTPSDLRLLPAAPAMTWLLPINTLAAVPTPPSLPPPAAPALWLMFTDSVAATVRLLTP